MVQRLLCVLGVVALLASPAAQACSCWPDEGETLEEKVSEAKARADAVVLAYALNVVGDDPRVTQQCELLDDGTVTDDCKDVVRYGREVAYFVTERAWKGEPGEEFRMVSIGMCDTVFSIGETYLIYMYDSDTPGQYSTSICTRTRQAERAEDDIRVLDSLPRSSGADEETDKLSLILDSPEQNGV